MYNKLKRINKTNVAASCWLMISTAPERIQRLSFLLDTPRVICEAGSNHFIIMQLVLFFTRLNFVYNFKHSFLFKTLILLTKWAFGKENLFVAIQK